MFFNLNHDDFFEDFGENVSCSRHLIQDNCLKPLRNHKIKIDPKMISIKLVFDKCYQKKNSWSQTIQVNFNFPRNIDAGRENIC